MKWLLARIHPMWHFAMMFYGIVAGVVISQWWSGVEWLLVTVLCIAVIVVVLKTQWRILLPVMLIVGVLIGLSRGGIDREQLELYQPLYGKSVIISGEVSDDADLVSGSTRIQISRIQLGTTNLPGQIWLSLYGQSDIKRGDVIRVSGKLQPGFGNFAGTLKSPKIQKVSRVDNGDVALQIRDSFAAAIHNTITDPAASLGIGFLLGKKSMLPQSLRDELKIVGLTHIIVASGYNLTILVRLARRLFSRASKYLATFVSFILIFSFIAMTGASPSMVRAGLVTGLSLLAWYVGRKFHPIMLIGLTAAITVLIRPEFAWGDMGWLLSFAAFAGVIVVAPIMTAYFFGKESSSTVVQILIETCAAQLVTAPIIMLAFGQFSAISLLANMRIGPFIPLAMLLTFIAGVAGVATIGFAHIVALPAQYLLDGMIKIVQWCADQPWAAVDVNLTFIGVLVWYVLAGLIVWYMKWRSGYRLRGASIVT